MVLQLAARRGVHSIKSSIRTIHSHTKILAPTNRASRQSNVSTALILRSGSIRTFSASSQQYKGLMPDSSDPPPRQAEEHDAPSTATELEFEEFHQIADQYLEGLVSQLEAKQEEKGDIEVEYAVRPDHLPFGPKNITLTHHRPVS